MISLTKLLSLLIDFKSINVGMIFFSKGLSSIISINVLNNNVDLPHPASPSKTMLFSSLMISFLKSNTLFEISMLEFLDESKYTFFCDIKRFKSVN